MTQNGVPYITYTFLGRPVASVAREPMWLRKKLPVCLRTTTLRKRLYKTGLHFSLTSGLDKFFGSKRLPEIVQDNSLNLSHIVRTIASELGYTILYPVIVYPASLSRKRFYMHLFSQEKKKIGFVKIGLDTINALSFNREGKMLELIHNSGNISFKTPEVLLSRHAGRVNYIVFSPIPDSIRPVSKTEEYIPEKIRRELSRKGNMNKAIQDLSWRDDYKRNETISESLYDYINTIGEACSTGWVHGDLTIENVYVDGRQYWVVDWENSAPDGPIETDRIVYDLNLLSRKMMKDTKGAIKDLRDKYFERAEKKERYQFAYAITFLCSRNHRGAEICSKYWNEFAERN